MCVCVLVYVHLIPVSSCCCCNSPSLPLSRSCTPIRAEVSARIGRRACSRTHQTRLRHALAEYHTTGYLCIICLCIFLFSLCVFLLHFIVATHQDGVSPPPPPPPPTHAPTHLCVRVREIFVSPVRSLFLQASVVSRNFPPLRRCASVCRCVAGLFVFRWRHPPFWSSRTPFLLPSAISCVLLDLHNVHLRLAW